MVSIYIFPFQVCFVQCLGIIGQDPSDSKPNRLHVDIFPFCSINFALLVLQLLPIHWFCKQLEIQIIYHLPYSASTQLVSSLHSHKDLAWEELSQTNWLLPQAGIQLRPIAFSMATKGKQRGQHLQRATHGLEKVTITTTVLPL